MSDGDSQKRFVTIGVGLEPGDQLIVQVWPENRACGFNPCPDGTIVTMVSFWEIEYTPAMAAQAKIRPGVYENHQQILVRLPNGRMESLHAIHLVPVDREKYKRLIDAWSEKRQSDPLYRLFVFLRPLARMAT